MPLSGNKRAHTVHRGDVRDERRSRPVVGRSLITPAARVQFPGWEARIIGLKTWLSTLEIVNRMPGVAAE